MTLFPNEVTFGGIGSEDFNMSLERTQFNLYTLLGVLRPHPQPEGL